MKRPDIQQEKTQKILQTIRPPFMKERYQQQGKPKNLPK